MKRNFRNGFLACAASLTMLFAAVSCSKDNGTDDDSAKEATFRAIAEQFVNGTVIPTYKSLADESVALYNALVALKTTKTDANVNAAADSWVKARDYWELSEAFLFGPAADFGIDPHIDTWPLAKDEFDRVLTNSGHIASLGADDGDEWAAEFLGPGVLGFHSIEYILFRSGQRRSAASIPSDELIVAVAVAGDLRNKCFQLEASWAGLDKVSAAKKEKLEALEANITIGRLSYGANMLNAGQPGSTNESFADACEDIVEGCMTIADEVGAMKIGKPHTGNDVNYIESPHSYNSKVDFIGNIKSIENVYLGGLEGQRGASLSDYVKVVNPKADSDIKAAITEAIAKIEAIPFPFAQNFSSKAAGDAMEACNELAEILKGAKTSLRQ
jgi:uncharacterized iron-regulated protein